MAQIVEDMEMVTCNEYDRDWQVSLYSGPTYVGR